jgi:long-chain acyl-CoA synthetase
MIHIRLTMDTVRDLVVRNAWRFPDKTAFVFEDRKLTFSQVDTRANRLANAWKKMGVRKGDRVAVFLDNSNEYCEILLAAAKAGVLLCTVNSKLKAGELTYIMEDSESSVLIFGEKYRGVIEAARGKWSYAKQFICVGDDPGDDVAYHELMEHESDLPPATRIDEEDPLYLIYTSGTTGRPKGVVLTHMNVFQNAVSSCLGLGVVPSDVNINVCPLAFVAGSVFQTISHFFQGATSVTMDGFSPKKFLETVQKEKVTFTFIVPTMLIMLIEHPEIEKYDLSSLRTIVYGGAPMPVDRLKKAMKIFGPILYQGYGLTEVSGNVCLLRKEDHKLDGTKKVVGRLASCGREHSNHKLRVFNERGQEVAPGEVGEIAYFGDSLMREYWKQPTETAASIRDGWFYTGDMATVDEEGYMYIVDRKKDIIISGGANISSKEVENAIYEHPAVLEAAVVGVPDDMWGEAVKAVVVLKPGASLTERELIDFCEERMAGYKKPKSVDFVDSLPKNPNDKIMKHAIRDRYWKGQERKVH